MTRRSKTIGILSVLYAVVAVVGVVAEDNTMTSIDGVHSSTTHRIYVGRYGTNNQLQIINGGVFSNDNDNVYVGVATTANCNHVFVSGVGSTWSINTNQFFYLGYRGTNNSMRLEGGSKMISGQSFIGEGATACSNVALVTGTDTSWSNSFLNVGVSGSGNALLITNGARVSVSPYFVSVGRYTGSGSNLLHVSGTGSVFHSANTVYHGQSGGGNSIKITDGGIAECLNGFHVGGSSGSGNNHLLVRGTGSTLYNPTGVLEVGGWQAENNDVLIDEGGMVSCDDCSVGYHSGSNRIVVSGDSSILMNSGELSIGSSATGNCVRISSNASVYASYVYIGEYEESRSNCLHVTDGGSFYATNGMEVGRGGSYNSLIVSNGGRVYVDEYLSCGSWLEAGRNLIHVTGTGTVLSVGESLWVSSYTGGNTLIAEQGAYVSSEGMRFGGDRYPSSNAVCLITGEGTVYSNRGGIDLEGSFSAMIVNSGAYLYAHDVYIDTTGSSFTVSGPDTRCDLTYSSSGMSCLSNTISVSNGAVLNAFSFNIEGRARECVIKVAGTGSVCNFWTMNIGSGFFSTFSSNNYLIVEDGGRVVGLSGIIGWESNDMRNAAIISGAGSAWICSNELRVSTYGCYNQLIVTNSGYVEAGTMYISGWGESSNNYVGVFSDASLVVNDTLYFRSGTNDLIGGSLYLGNLDLTNENSVFNFESGHLQTRQLRVSTGPFVVGNGVDPASYYIESGPPTGHIFMNDLIVNTNAALQGNGIITSGRTAMLDGSMIQPGGTGMTATLTVQNLELHSSYAFDFDLSATGTDKLVVASSLTSAWQAVNTIYLHDLGGADWNATNVFMQCSTNLTHMLWMVDYTEAPAASNVGIWQTGTEISLVPVTAQYVCRSGLHVPRYENWIKAATNIPDAVAVSMSDIPLFVTNGTWHSGGDDSSGSLLTLDDITIATAPSASYFDFCVGVDGDNNRLVMQNGSMVNCQEFAVSRNASSLGNIAVVQDLGTILNCTNFYAGRDGAGSSVVISNGANVNCHRCYVAHTATSLDNSISVIGDGSALSNRDIICVGNSGPGNTLLIRDGGLIVSPESAVGCAIAASSNSVIVSGTNSLWQPGVLTVGYASSYNRLAVTNGGTCSARQTHIGNAGTVSNVLHVSGAASCYSNTINLEVGNGGGESLLIIDDNAAVYGGAVYVGAATGSLGNRCYINGNDSLLSVTQLYVGHRGFKNEVFLSFGADVVAQDIVLGSTDQANGSVFSVDSGCSVTVANLTIGQHISSVNNRVKLLSGSLCTITNVCDVLNGTNELYYGTMNIDTLRMTNSAAGLEADGSTLNIRQAIVSAGSFGFNAGMLTVDQLTHTGGSIDFSGGTCRIQQAVFFADAFNYMGGNMDLLNASATGSAPFSVGNGSQDAYLIITGTTAFASGLKLNGLSTFEYEGRMGASFMQLSGGALEPAGTNAGTMTMTNMVIENGSHYYFDAGLATQDLIEVLGALTNDTFPTVTLHVRNLGGADWSADRTILTYGSVTGEINWVVDLGYSGASQLTVVHEPSSRSYVLKEPAIYYVAPGGSDTFPYDRWDRAAHSIQTVADLSSDGDYVYVSNGVYSAGGRVAQAGGPTNRLCVTNAVYVHAVNGPTVTFLVGAPDPVSTNGPAAVRCVYLADGAVLRGFNLSGGHTLASGDDFYDVDGGGALLDGEVVLWDCVFQNNHAYDDGGGVRGTAGAKLCNSVVIFNAAGDDGGGVYACNLYGATLAGNTAFGDAGGVYGGSVMNSIIFNNAAGGSGSNYVGTVFSYTCTAPLPTGSGNVSMDPQFTDFGIGTLSLEPTSPCINIGNDAAVMGTNDVVGFERIYSGCSDLGAYETFRPWIAITNPGNDQIVSYDANLYVFEGNKNPNTSEIDWTNSLNGFDGSEMLDNSWAWSAVISLSVGTNTVRVQGVNTLSDTTNDSVRIIRADIGSGRPIVTIVNAPTTVNYGVTSYTLIGTNNPHIFGTMWISNTANGEAYSFNAASNWTAPSVYLVEGVNNIIVQGTNHWSQLGSTTAQVTRLAKQPGDSNLTYYVAEEGLHIEPFLTWANAATQMQDAVGLAYSNDTVLVGNGFYYTGGQVDPGYLLTNRVLIGRGVTVQSVNGPYAATIIGQADPLTTNGPAAIRCVAMYPNSRLLGFTLYSGHTTTNGEANRDQSGGGAICIGGGYISNCFIHHCTADNYGGGVDLHHGGTIVDCTLYNNHVGCWGGAILTEKGYIEDCEIYNNSSDNDAGGVFIYETGTVYNAIIYSNTASDAGAGVYMYNGGTVLNSIIEGNTSYGPGGGILTREGAFVDKCIIRNNFAGDGSTEDGGGVCVYNGGRIRNCLITENEATNCGGGVFFEAYASNGLVENCTIISNRAEYGGGIRTWNGTNRNCIIYNNSAWGAGDNWSYGGNNPVVEYTCITPTNGIPGGEGCITNEPIFIDAVDYVPIATSPVLDVGTNQSWMADARTISGHNRIMRYIVDMGWQEFVAEDLQASPIHYVSLNGCSIWPYTNWMMAATIIQDAVDTASASDAVLVSNGTYTLGDRTIGTNTVTHRVVIGKPVHVRGINGPNRTFVEGGYGVRCVYMTNGAMLSGVTITNGRTFSWGDPTNNCSGGGVFFDHGGSISNCIITGCDADHNGGGVYGFYGGAVVNSELCYNETSRKSAAYHMEYGGLIDRCHIHHNDGGQDGGAVYVNAVGTIRNSLFEYNEGFSGGAVYLANTQSNSASMYNCVVVYNYGQFDAGGVRCLNGGTVWNCIIVSNWASSHPEYANTAIAGAGASCSYSCTHTPQIYNIGNTTNDPLFVGSNDYHLHLSSPCIDAGTNTVWSEDNDNMPRPLDGDANGTAIIDMGIYEFLNPLADSDGDLMRDAWELAHQFSPTNPVDGALDSDGDGDSNAREWGADTDPHNSNSYFHVITVEYTNACAVSFDCSTARVYELQYSSHLVTGLWKVVEGQTNIPGEVSGSMSLHDTNDMSCRAYRVNVQPPE